MADTDTDTAPAGAQPTPEAPPPYQIGTVMFDGRGARPPLLELRLDRPYLTVEEALALCQGLFLAAGRALTERHWLGGLRDLGVAADSRAAVYRHINRGTPEVPSPFDKAAQPQPPAWDDGGEGRDANLS